ncbi:MAG: DUF1330 domain-containing protein [Rhodoblastus sp.]|nr:MAG: DUF1330 domain-containing protein [Rhodoblastus sp.]
MAILNISTAAIKDADAFRDYVARAAVLLQAQGVEILARGRYVETLRGARPGDHIVAAFRFRDRDAVARFYESDDYAPLVALRDKACEMTIQLYEE